jgi:hypothetical protein
MPRTFAAAVLLAALALLPPGTALAGPPEGASGKMVQDDVADGLRKYKLQRNESNRARQLKKLSEIIDARVMMAVGESLTDTSQEVRRAAADVVFFRYAGGCVLRVIPPPEQVEKGARQWWVRYEAEIRRWRADVENEADLRRRAAQLPR